MSFKVPFTPKHSVTVNCVLLTAEMKVDVAGAWHGFLHDKTHLKWEIITNWI